MVGTKINLAYVLNFVNQHMSKAKKIHWKIIKMIIKYFKYIFYFKLYLKSHNIALHNDNDVNWAENINDKRSIMKYVFFFCLSGSYFIEF